MKRIVIYCILALTTLAAAARPVKDSLLRALHTQPHDSTRLMTLHALARLDQNTPTFIYYEDLLLKEATAQKNIKYQCIAMHNHVIYYFNHADKKRVQQWVGRLSRIAPQHGFYDLYFDAKRWLIELHFQNEEVELGLHEAQKMAAEAQQVNNDHGLIAADICLLSGYIITLQNEKALKVAQEAHALISPNDPPLNRINNLMRIMVIYSYLQYDEGVLNAINELKLAYNQIDPAIQSAYTNILMSIESNYVVYYTRCNQLEQAREHLALMEAYNRPFYYTSAKVDRLNAYAEYYRQNKEYDKALAARDSIIILAQNYPGEIIIQNKKRADILIDAGRMEDALPLYQRAILQNDSINRSISQKQMDQIQSIYNVDKLLLEKEELKGTIYIIALIIAGILLTLSGISTVHSQRTKTQLKLAEKEIREATLITEETNEVKNRFLSNLSYNIRIPLNNVVGFSQLIAADPNIEGAALKDYSKIIQKNSNELIQMVNDVLDLSRLEARMMRFNLTDYDIVSLCNDSIGQIRIHESPINTTLQTTLESGQVSTDISRISQVLVSLLTYPVLCDTPRKTLINLTEQKGMYTVAVHNTPMADSEFATQAVAIRHEINRLIVEHFGGTYKVKADSAEGPTVIFTIPAAETPKMNE